MSSPATHDDWASLQERLARLRKQASTTARQGARRRQWLAAAVGVAVAAMGVGLLIVYNRVADFDARALALNAQGEFFASLPESRDQLAAELRAQAPRVVDAAAAQAQAWPEGYGAAMRRQWRHALDAAAAQARVQASARLRDQAGPVAARIAEQHPNDPRARAQLLVDELAELYGIEARKAADATYEPAHLQIREVGDYLDTLARGGDLTPRQRAERELARATLAVLDKWAKAAKPAESANGDQEPSAPVKPGSQAVPESGKPSP